MATDDHLKMLLRQLDLLEKDLVVYHDHADKFYDIWSRLTTKGQGFTLLCTYQRYGKFLLNYTFKESEEVTETKYGRIIRQPLEGCVDTESKVAGIAFLLFRLSEEYPQYPEKAFTIPRHKSLSDDKKKTMQEWKSIIVTCLEKIKNRLNLLEPIITYVRETK